MTRQEPCEVGTKMSLPECEDAISRKTLTDKMEHLCDCLCEYSKKQRSIMCGACKLGSVFDVIEDLQPVQPQQKTGQWITSNISDEKYVCSECGGACWYYDCKGEVSKSRYCPSCGAKMERSEK